MVTRSPQMDLTLSEVLLEIFVEPPMPGELKLIRAPRDFHRN